ncbi:MULTISPECIES: acyl-CoA dehydrogenase family protein [unclassified Blastococcus]
MRLTPTADQEELRDTVRAFLDRHCGSEDVRRQMATERGWDPAVWRRAATELGLTGLEVPEELGGAGAGFGEVAVVLEETGRSLACLPYFSTVVLASGVLLLGDDEQARADLLPGIADGSRTATLALAGETGSWDPAAPTVTASADPGGWTLDGVSGFVVDGRTADLVLVAAGTTAGGPSVFAVDGAAPGLTRTPLTTLDPTRKLARLEFSRTPARLLGGEGTAGPLLERVLDRALAGLACEQVGGAQATLDAAVAHARDRRQFGRPIGSFQAIKHRCADMLQQLEGARAAASWAVATVADGSGDAPAAAAMAAVRCAEAFRFTSAESIQVHGGMGFTWEHPAHLYFRRAASSAELLGSPAAHRERLLQAIGV